jgi:hypothetical protein
MPSSSFVTPNRNRSRIAHDPKSGAQVPYSPFPNPRIPKTMHINKMRLLNPFIINRPHMSYA